MLPRARFLVRGGYDVLALDLRGHGESGGSLVSPGLLEARDVLAGERFLRQREPHARIAALGVSYGAVAALLAAAESPPPGLAAVIADGAFPSGRAVFGRTVDHYLHHPGSPLWAGAVMAAAAAPGLIRAIGLAYYLRTGVDLGPDFVSAISAAPRIRVPVLLISGGSDWMVPTADARRLRAALGSAWTTLLVIPGARHDTTYSTAPDVYEQAVLSFLARALGP
jgi:alpha-beta hydrolase superfamily lysophospholipase